MVARMRAGARGASARVFRWSYPPGELPIKMKRHWHAQQISLARFQRSALHAGIIRSKLRPEFLWLRPIPPTPRFLGAGVSAHARECKRGRGEQRTYPGPAAQRGRGDAQHNTSTHCFKARIPNKKKEFLTNSARPPPRFRHVLGSCLDHIIRPKRCRWGSSGIHVHAQWMTAHNATSVNPGSNHKVYKKAPYVLPLATL